MQDVINRSIDLCDYSLFTCIYNLNKYFRQQIQNHSSNIDFNIICIT